MRKWVKAFTYEGKIPYVISGECGQTVRVGREIAVGDEILFHGWSGKPYRSRWSWRVRVRVVEVVPILFSWDSFSFWGEDGDEHKHSWWDSVVAEIAKKDYIVDCGLPLGVCLRNVIFSLGGKKMEKDREYEGQIITFKKIKQLEEFE